jgi:hypothetical protein
MKHTISILTIILTCQSFLFGQIDSSYVVSRFKNITDMPYICEGEVNKPGCGQTAFWDVVMKRDSSIPILLSILDDTTQTMASVPNFGGNWTIGDIAYNALEEIIDGIPTFKLLGVKFDKKGCGYCAYWNHLRDDYKNRQAFEARVTRWYYKNKNRLVWVQSNETLTCDCRFNHPNGGHYELKR